MKHPLLSVLVSAAMVVGPLPALSADTGPLAPGGAAGIQQAQGADEPPLLWLIGAGVVIGVGILILAKNNDNNAVPITSTTATTTTTTTTTKAATTTTTTTTGTAP